MRDALKLFPFFAVFLLCTIGGDLIADRVVMLGGLMGMAITGCGMVAFWLLGRK